MAAPHASTATWKTSSANSLPIAARRMEDATVARDSEARTVPNPYVARCPMGRIAHHGEAQRSVNAQTAGQASTAMSARLTMPATP